MEKLPGVLWAYQTTKRIPTDETLFSLEYGTEAIISVDILRMERIERHQNAIQLRLTQDQPEERQQAQIRIAAYQQKIWASQHKKVKTREFQVDDLVLKRIIQSTQERNIGKLRPNWEGPYTVVTKGGKGSYMLVDQDGKMLNKPMEFFSTKTVLCVKLKNIQ